MQLASPQIAKPKVRFLGFKTKGLHEFLSVSLSTYSNDYMFVSRLTSESPWVCLNRKLPSQEPVSFSFKALGSAFYLVTPYLVTETAAPKVTPIRKTQVKTFRIFEFETRS